MARFATVAMGVAVLWACICGNARAQDDSELFVRINRLEGQVRQLSGQLEQIQFDNRQLKEQLRKFQEDVEFRLNERGGGSRGAPPAATTQTPSAAPRPARRGDAYDPANDPAAPGAPRQLGAASQPSAPLVAESAPAPARRPPRGEDTAFAESYGGAPPADLSATARAGGTLNPGAAAAARAAPSVAATGGDDARADYESATALYGQKQYDGAEMALRRFIQSHPRDRLVPDATYLLGETYLQRSRPREAAEQFLKVSTEFSRSTRAPEAMLRLGVSLSALGAKDQACATFAEVERKFPTAGPGVKQGVEREQKRARCPA